MSNWYMLTIVGADKPGIVAKITQSLYINDCNLGEASMLRLGANFTIMLMVSSKTSKSELEKALRPSCQELSLECHINNIQGKLHHHHIPNTSITVSGSDKAGIVAQVTGALFNAGLDILDLTSDVAGTEDNPIYIMQIDGICANGIEAIEKAILPLTNNGIDIQVKSIDTLIG